MNLRLPSRDTLIPWSSSFPIYKRKNVYERNFLNFAFISPVSFIVACY